MNISVSAFGVQSEANAETLWWDDPQQVSTGRFSYGSGRLFFALWPKDRLDGPLAGDNGAGTSLGRGTAPERPEPLTRRPPLGDGLFGSLRSVETAGGERVIALTFDLCQQYGRSSGYDAEAVRVLREFDVRATFFVGGLWMRSHPERAMQLMADPRFELGNHGWSHRDAASESDGFTGEVLWTQSQYELLWEQLYGLAARADLAEEMALVPRLPLTFRFPFGSCDGRALRELSDLGLPAVQWSVAPGDPDPDRSVQALERAILDRVRPGAIVVLHANGRGVHTAQALRAAIPVLTERGYRFVTVSDLLFSGRALASPTCFLLEPGDLER